MKKKFIERSFCLMLAIALCFGELVPPSGSRGAVPADVSAETAVSAKSTDTGYDDYTPIEQSEGVVRPEDIDEGLSINSLDDIRGRRVTVRQPVMEILDDKVPRTPADEYDNVYVMKDLKKGTEMHKDAKIDFASDKELQVGNEDHPMYPMRGLKNSPKENGTVTSQPYFSEFKKYMLLRQAWYFNTHVSEIIEKKELKKHPAADYIYGEIPDDAYAVKMHIVTDPIYRSPMTTGLYLVPGEEVKVKIKGLKAGETVTMYTHHQDTMGYQGYSDTGSGFSSMEAYLNFWDTKIVDEAKLAEKEHRAPQFEKYSYGIHGQWMWQNQKVPCMGTTFNIVGTGQETEVTIGSMYGGPLYIKPTNDTVDLEITGAVLTPHFVLGVTTVEEFNEQLRNAPGLIATLDVENGQLIGPAKDMRNCDDIEKLAYFWHSVFAIDISLNGRDYNYNMTMCYDMHVPAGEAVALNSNFCAQPEYWFPICMNYETLTTKGNWGTFHELGHVQAKTHGVNWGFCDGDGEVWNNTLILLIYSMLCNMDSRVIYVEHGEYVHPYTAIERSQKITKTYVGKEDGQVHQIQDYGEINEGNGAHFDQLSMYATLLHSFGPEKFVDMFYTYKMNPAYCANKRADFVYRIGVVDRVNILEWVNTNYFARIDDSMFTAAQREFLNNLPKFVPVAYRWANGIDGHETARKYDVDGKHSTVFDLSKDSFSSPGKVEVMAVTQPKYGTIQYTTGDTKATYVPSTEKLVEYDSFDIIVKTEGGRRVTLNVNMRLVYKGMYAEVWKLGESKQYNNTSVTKAKEMVEKKDSYDYAITLPSASWSFNNKSGDYNPVEYIHLQFKYRIPETGSYTFYVKSDDCSTTTFYKNSAKSTSLGKIEIGSYIGNYQEGKKVDAQLTVGETIFIDCDLVNWGGQGGVTFGVRMPNTDEIITLPAENILSDGVEEADLPTINSFKGWQPHFVDSIKNATIDYQTSNTGWKVLVAPESEGNQEDAKRYLVDGDESTAFHSAYQHGRKPTPHAFIIDTGADQTFNYFEALRRTNGNDRLYSYALYSCTSKEFEGLPQDGKSTDGWHKLFDGASSNVNAARQRISFPRTEIRYFMFIVNDNGSANATRDGNTVIKEFYAGVESQLSQTVKPSNYMTEDTKLASDKAQGFVENSANGKLSTTKSGATFEFKFLGSGFEIFADTDPAYGKANVYVDNDAAVEITLKDEMMFNKQVFLRDDLEMGVHTVKIETLSTAPFNISFINVKYGTPVATDEYPAVDNDYGDVTVDRQFTREWKTLVKDYKDLTSIKFVDKAPEGYKDTYVRIDTYIRLYRLDTDTEHKIAFVYPGTILAPIECGSLFSGCASLKEIGLDNFDTTYMRGAMSMFYGCSSLTSIDLSKFTTENVLSYGKMFGGCTSLTDIDLSSFELDESSNIYRMFDGCVALKTIELPDTVAVQKTRAIATSTISCELPYVYQDEVTRKFITEIVLDPTTAGHKLTLHNHHNLTETHQLQEPTCVADGTLAYKVCADCKCMFNYVNEKDLYRERDIVIPALGHNFIYEYDFEHMDDSPNCTKPGTSGYYKCDRCGEIKGESAVIPALGHTFEVVEQDIEFIRREELVKTDVIGESGEYEYTKEELVVKGIAKVTITLKCCSFSDFILWTECGYTTKVVIEIECDTYSAATCTENETFFYDFDITEEMLIKAIAEQDKQDDVADYITSFYGISVCETTEGLHCHGHQMEKVDARPATCLAYGSTAGEQCSVCGITSGVTPLEPTGHEMVQTPYLAPTCTTAGHAAGKVCKNCGLEDEGVRHIDPLGHEFTVDIPAEAPTCTKVGHTEGKKCTRCEAVEGCEVVHDLGHDPVVMPGKAATNTESGLTEGLRCSRCGEILEPQKTIAALGGNKVGCGGCSGSTGYTNAVIACAVLLVTAVHLKRRRK